MASNAIHEMISAYAAGCLDKKNYEQFRDYVKGGGDLPTGELGELQNVISLLPVILELEKPSPKLKDKVAKKLIGLQEDIKEKIKLTKQRTAAATEAKEREATEVEERREPTKVETRFSEPEEEVIPTKVTRFTEEQPRKKTYGTEFYDSIKPHSAPPPPTRDYDLPPRSMKDLEVKRKAPILVWVAIGLSFVILLAGLIIVYFSTTDYERQISALEQRIDDLQNQVQSTREFVERYDELIEFMTYEDMQVISLSPVDETTSGSGKILISFVHREALLELSGMPTIGTNQAFQVWLISEGRSYSLGSYVPNQNDRYIPINNIPYIPRNEIDLVRITIEPLTGSDVPQGPAVLFGAVNNSPQ